MIYRESSTTPHGWATPFVPSLLGTSLILIVSFVTWEIRREARGESVLVPMSMWSQPGAKMGPIISLVVFGWWAFNTLSYFLTIYMEEVKQLTPLQTALQLTPSAISVSPPKGSCSSDDSHCILLQGFMTNVVTGYLIAFVPSQILVLIGLGSCIVCQMVSVLGRALTFMKASGILFAVVDTHITYWGMTFIIVILLPVLDLAYTVANMQVCSSFREDSQALAGSLFSVATRVSNLSSLWDFKICAYHVRCSWEPHLVFP